MLHQESSRQQSSIEIHNLMIQSFPLSCLTILFHLPNLLPMLFFKVLNYINFGWTKPRYIQCLLVSRAMQPDKIHLYRLEAYLGDPASSSCQFSSHVLPLHPSLSLSLLVRVCIQLRHLLNQSTCGPPPNMTLVATEHYLLFQLLANKRGGGLFSQ